MIEDPPTFEQLTTVISHAMAPAFLLPASGGFLKILIVALAMLMASLTLLARDVHLAIKSLSQLATARVFLISPAEVWGRTPTRQGVS